MNDTFPVGSEMRVVILDVCGRARDVPRVRAELPLTNFWNELFAQARQESTACESSCWGLTDPRSAASGASCVFSALSVRRATVGTPTADRGAHAHSPQTPRPGRGTRQSHGHTGARHLSLTA